jgi:hypothetical protein
MVTRIIHTLEVFDYPSCGDHCPPTDGSLMLATRVFRGFSRGKSMGISVPTSSLEGDDGVSDIEQEAIRNIEKKVRIMRMRFIELFLGFFMLDSGLCYQSPAYSASVDISIIRKPLRPMSLVSRLCYIWGELV